LVTLIELNLVDNRHAVDVVRVALHPRQLCPPCEYSVKRDLLQCQKRPTTVSKERLFTRDSSAHPASVMFRAQGLEFRV
jgi:hypothetical protein